MQMNLNLMFLLFAIFQVSVRGNIVIISLYAMELHASTLQLGFIVAATALFPMIFAVYAGKASDRIGFRFPLVFSTFAAGLALLLPFLFQDELFILIVSQSLFGLAHIFTLVTIQNLVGAMSSQVNRSKNFAAMSLSISIANLIAPFITGLSIDHLDYHWTYLLLSVIAIVPGLFFTFKKLPVPNGESKEEASRSFMDLLGYRPLRSVLITSGIILTGIGIYEFYFPIFGKHIGLSASAIGIILSINASANFIVRLFMQRLIQKYKEEMVLSGCLFVSAGAFVLMPFFENFYLLAMVSFLMGLGLGCGQPLSIVMAYSRSPKGRTGEVLGVRITVNKMVQFIVPIAFGSLGSLFGFFPVFWSNGLLFIISGYLMIKKNSKSPEQRSLES